MTSLPAQPSWLNRIARVLLCLVFINAVLGKVTGFGTVAGVIAAKGLPLAPVLLVAAMALMEIVITSARSSTAKTVMIRLLAAMAISSSSLAAAAMTRCAPVMAMISFSQVALMTTY